MSATELSDGSFNHMSATEVSESPLSASSLEKGERITFGYVMGKFRDAFKSSLTNRYLMVNSMYLAYAIGILVIDFEYEPNAVTDEDYAYNNKLYLGWGVIHLWTALLYMWSWKTFSVIHIIQIPEYLNVVGACLYIVSANYYGDTEYEYDPDIGYYYTDDVTWRVHKLETTSAVIEVVAAFGWIATWWLTYLRTPSRGWTLDDPDVIAWLCTLSASAVYVTYNGQIMANPEEYDYNELYKTGDIIYFVGACFYCFAAMRDDGWWWFMPLAGQFHLRKEVKVETGDGVVQLLEESKKVMGVRGFLLRCGVPTLPRSWLPEYWIKTSVIWVLSRCCRNYCGCCRCVDMDEEPPGCGECEKCWCCRDDSASSTIEDDDL